MTLSTFILFYKTIVVSIMLKFNSKLNCKYNHIKKFDFAFFFIEYLSDYFSKLYVIIYAANTRFIEFFKLTSSYFLFLSLLNNV